MFRRHSSRPVHVFGGRQRSPRCSNTSCSAGLDGSLDNKFSIVHRVVVYDVLPDLPVMCRKRPFNWRLLPGSPLACAGCCGTCRSRPAAPSAASTRRAARNSGHNMVLRGDFLGAQRHV